MSEPTAENTITSAPAPAPQSRVVQAIESALNALEIPEHYTAKLVVDTTGHVTEPNGATLRIRVVATSDKK